jgi:hypothetical protein
MKRSFEKRSVVDSAGSADGESFERLVAPYPTWLGCESFTDDLSSVEDRLAPCSGAYGFVWETQRRLS